MTRQISTLLCSECGELSAIVRCPGCGDINLCTDLCCTTVHSLKTFGEHFRTEVGKDLKPSFLKNLENEIKEMEPAKLWFVMAPYQSDNNFSFYHKLETFSAGYNELIAVSSRQPNTIPFVISMIGDTNAGKSVLAKALMLDRSFDVQSLYDDDSNTATLTGDTSDVRVHRSQDHFCLSSSHLSSIYVNDLEGQNARGVPTSALSLLGEFVQKQFFDFFSDGEKRLNAVNLLMPSLSFFLSDVIVFVDISTFANVIFSEKILSYLKKVNLIDQSFKPHLILISNKYSAKTPEECLDSDYCTKVFLGALKTPDDFLKSFASVKCFCLTNWNENPRVKGKCVNGQERFESQLMILLNRIKSLYSERIEEKKKFMPGMSEEEWLKLVTSVILDFPTTEFPNKTVTPFALTYLSFKNRSIGNIPVRNAISLLGQLTTFLLSRVNGLNKENITSYFNEAIKTTLKSLAASLVFEFQQKGELNTTRAFLNDKTKKQEFEDDMLKLFNLFIETIDFLRPCGSTYKLTIDGNTTTVLCCHGKGFHGTTHFNPVKQYRGQDNQKFFSKQLTNIKGIFGFGYPLTWDGKYVPVEKKTEMERNAQELKSYFIGKILEFLNKEKSAILSEVISFRNDFESSVQSNSEYYQEQKSQQNKIAKEVQCNDAFSKTNFCGYCLTENETCKDCIEAFEQFQTNENQEE